MFKMPVTFNNSLKLIVSPKLIASPPQCAQLLHRGDYLLLLWKKCGDAKQKHIVGIMCRDCVLIELISFASDLQQTRRPVGAAESKRQMRSCLCLGAATLRLLFFNTFHLACFFCFCFVFTLSCSVFKPSLCILISQYAPLSLRPLTCEVKAGHRWGPREQGCIQFQRPTKEKHFVKYFNLWRLF